MDLLDEAAEYLLPSDARTYDRSAYFSKDAALALKAKVLLYAASPLFNGNEFYADFKGKNGEPLFSTEPDPEKWRLAAEAADEAVKFCEDHGHILTSGSAGKGSKLLNTMYDIEFSVHSDFDNPEFILEWKFAHLSSHYLPLLPTNLNHVNYDATGSLNPSLKMVEMFYTETVYHWKRIIRGDMNNDTSKGEWKRMLNTRMLFLSIVPRRKFCTCI